MWPGFLRRSLLRAPRQRQSHGFTLIEVLTVLAVMGVLAGISYPFGTRWVEQSNINNTRNQISSAVGVAHSWATRNPHAVPRGVAVVRMEVNAGVLEVQDLTTSDVLYSVELGRVYLLNNASGTYGCSEWDSRRTLVSSADCSAISVVYLAHRGHPLQTLSLL